MNEPDPGTEAHFREAMAQAIRQPDQVAFRFTRQTPSGDPRGPHRGDVFLHIRSGREYVVLGIVRLEAEGVPAVRYTSADGDGEEWVRSVADWFLDRGDGPRFELVRRVVLS